MGARASRSEASHGPPLPPLGLARPRRAGGRSVLAALWARTTSRNIAPRGLSHRELSELLWAAVGVNRRKGRGPFGGVGLTAASASNAQEVVLYAALPQGIYRYDGAAHRLVPVVRGDHRPLAISPGQRSMLGEAPVELVYVVDVARYDAAPFQEPGLHDAGTRTSYGNVAVGLVAGNVELYAASMGLASWFHNCDRRALSALLRLRPGQRVLYGHTVGYTARARQAKVRPRVRRGGAA